MVRGVRSEPDALPPISPLAAYRLRWKRRRALWRALRARHALTAVTRHPATASGAILGGVCLRNERIRLPHFLAHHRALGVDRFLIVDNASDDGTTAYLRDQPDVSLWTTGASYRAARFGMDWLNWLLTRYGHGHWCLTVDADELLVYPDYETRRLPALTAWLDRTRRPAFGALMLDLYPRGRLGDGARHDDPLQTLRWFDAGPYSVKRQSPAGNLWVQGGPRARVFFADDPRRAPTLNKLPLVRWRRGMAYVNSTHAMLPRKLNAWYDGPGGAQPSGVLLHTKFLPDIVARSAQERGRAQHFHTPAAFGDYYDRIAQRPDLWSEGSCRYDEPEQLAELGLLHGWSWKG
ncbi:glycosyltransferase family 2 protein [Citreimonas salinaria]|uniref:Glycosyl transferase family 2 n=1 Tax=Citreimonas salinaria TaxID=321339 RepID=A0A1H3LUA3_9RHOB|nr:glycosyltransferase family 2 protein [Citreimonas salinaria]SDY67981.1 Glycosyl transferase family 2 [Citreimonas salinaria]